MQTNPTHQQIAEALPVRRDMVTLLTYVRDHKVTGTSSTGNFPRKHIRAMTAQFVHPPTLDTTIGDRVYKLRTEFDIWPLYFLHILAIVAGLLSGGPSRRMKLTPEGETFLKAGPLVQVWSLLFTWWKATNWLVAFPFEGIGEYTPPDFEEITLEHLLDLPAETRIEFEPFADRLIQATRLEWGAKESPYARIALHKSIERMVIDILTDFGIVEPEYKVKLAVKDFELKDLLAFQITPFGKYLLQSICT
jgi:hypothetical protein